MGNVSCKHFVDQMGDYVEGILPSDQRLAMDAHRIGCPQCRGLLADYERIPGVVRRATDVVMPLDARARLRRFLSRARGSRR